jgi:parallel beta-helix repeat protein
MIQDAVDVALAGDTVVVTNGVYGTGGRAVAGTLTNRVATDRPIIVQSVNGPEFTLIEGAGEHGSSNRIRCVYLGTNAVLSGFTLTNGWASTGHDDASEVADGGGVWSELSGVVNNCTLTGNSARFGGGAYGGTLYNCTLNGNRADRGGGGAAYSTLSNCILTENVGGKGYGGGAYDGTLNNCTLTGNGAEAGGGALRGTLNNCTLAGNGAMDGGGALYGTLNYCTLTGNSASFSGGGASGGTLHNCTLTGNSAGFYGGGASDGTLNNCTLMSNSAGKGGGGASGGTLNNCILYYNTANSGPNYFGSTLNYCCTTPDPGSGAGNITAEPLFVDLAAGNYRLRWDSPCVDAGTNLTGLVTNDLDGNPRPLDGNGDGIAAFDLGAYELKPVRPIIVSQPQDRTNVAGTTATFTLDAYGTAPLHYEWRFEGAELSGETNQALRLTRVTPSQAGDYTLVVSNAYGSITSAVVRLTVIVPDPGPRYVWQDSPDPAPPYADWATAAHTIQEAVDVALAGDTVLVTNGVYGTGGRGVVGTLTNRVAIDRPIIVQSVNGSEHTLIEGASRIRCVYLGPNAVLSGFTLTHGQTSYSHNDASEVTGGGGVWSELSGVVSNCCITGNSALRGGGACGGTLYNCVLSNNSGPFGFGGNGGGAYAATLYNCTLSENRGQYGGGAYSSMLYHCTLTNNYAGDDGGGASGGTLYDCHLTHNAADDGCGAAGSTLYNCTLTTNRAWNTFGGGVRGGTLNNCTLTGNSAFRYGGGANGGTLNNCNVTGNSAEYGGGASRGTLNNCTLASNSADISGGGAYGATLNNCIVYYNTAGVDGANYYSSTLDYCCTTPLPPTGVGNITAEPLFVDLLNGNLRLQPTSPCIDAGTNQDWMIGATDLDGNPRISGGVVDLGAFEFPTTPPFIMAQPLDQTVNEGGATEFSVPAGGTAPLAYQWWLSNAPIANATAPHLFITDATMNSAGIYCVVVTNGYGAVTSSNAALTVLPAQAKIRAMAASGVSGVRVVVPIHLTASSNENALGFSLVYDPAVLLYDSAALGSGSAGGSFLANTSQTQLGRLGIAVALPTGVAYALGTQEVAQVTFLARPVTAVTMTLVNFGDQPTSRELVNVAAVPLAATYSGAAVQITPGTYEADVAGRPNGDHSLSIADWVQEGRFVAGLDTVTNPNEFLRADCAPRSNLGNGNLTVTDWVQAGRYAVGLDPITIVGGPTAGHSPGALGPLASKEAPSAGEGLRALRVLGSNLWAGQTVTTCLQMDSLGDETALGTSLQFDSTALVFLSARLGAHAPGATLNVNTNESAAGKVGLLLSLPFGSTLASGTRELVLLDFQASAHASGVVSLAMDDVPVVREVSDAAANALSTVYENGVVEVAGLPVLNAALLNQSIQLSWTVPTALFVLQASETMAGWSDVVEPSTTNGLIVSVTLPQSSTHQFFRLRKN